MVIQLNDEEKAVREKTRAAVNQAKESRWDEAIATNRELLELVPEDVEASNRLGRAYMELGQLTNAAAAFRNSLDIAPSNTIARKNLDRLAALGPNGAAGQGTNGGGFSPALFISEGGKSTTVTLASTGVPPQCNHLAAGAPVELRADGERLLAYDSSGQSLGAVPANVGARVSRLMAGGNHYDGALVRALNGEVTVLLREVHQDPSQRSLVSFPSTAAAAQPDEAEAEPSTLDAEVEPGPSDATNDGAEAALPVEDTEDEEGFIFPTGDQDDDDAEGTVRSPTSLDSAVDAELAEDDEDEDEAM